MDLELKKEIARLEALGWWAFPLKGKVPAFLRDDDGSWYQWKWKEHGKTYDYEHYKTATGVGIGAKKSKLLIIDVDTSRGDGHGDLALLEATHEINLWKSAKAVARTGRDGLHFYFDAPEDLGKLKGHWGTTNIDVRYDAYIAAPSSIHPDTGVVYEWEKEPVPALCVAPPIVIEMISKPEAPQLPLHKPTPYEGDSVIEIIRSQETVEGLLLGAGYVQVGRKWLAPGSSSKVAGVAILDDGRVVSHHSSASCDIAAHQGSHSLDAVDLMRIFRFGGDMQAMLDYYRPPETWDDSLLVDESEEAPKPKKKREKKVSDLEKRAASIEPWDIPGRAREVYEWIDSQCIYPRQTLAAGAALWCISNAGGLSHFDERDDLGLNLLIFAVAASATGKEAIMQSATRLMSEVEISRALHGKIKSEQEIYRNLTDHQAALYLVDEVGIMMQKIISATKKGGAIYLEGVIGAIMEVYTKSRGILSITGDQKRELLESIEKRIANEHKKLDAGRGSEAGLESLNRRLQDAENGLKEPYLTLYGATTPSTFDTILTPENAQNGLLGRALILREHEDNPKRRERVERLAPPEEMISWLRNLYWNGGYEAGRHRVETQGERRPIFTIPEAAFLLDEVYHDFWEIAEAHKEVTGLAAIPRRGWEITSKLSLVLAMADGGTRTAEHVMYAYAMARRDVSTKLRYAFASSEVVHTGSDTQKAMAVASLLSGLSKDVGETMRNIERRACYKTARVFAPTREAMEALLTELAESGEIKVEKTARTTKYYLT